MLVVESKTSKFSNWFFCLKKIYDPSYFGQFLGKKKFDCIFVLAKMLLKSLFPPSWLVNLLQFGQDRVKGEAASMNIITGGAG